MSYMYWWQKKLRRTLDSATQRKGLRGDSEKKSEREISSKLTWTEAWSYPILKYTNPISIDRNRVCPSWARILPKKVTNRSNKNHLRGSLNISVTFLLAKYLIWVHIDAVSIFLSHRESTGPKIAPYLFWEDPMREGQGLPPSLSPKPRSGPEYSWNFPVWIHRHEWDP